LVDLAVLGLLSGVAGERPLICLVDDDEVLQGSRTGDPIGFSWKGTGSSGQESEEVFS
jgi:hypothetical protein